MSATPSSPLGYFADDDHAMKYGFLIGTMMKAGVHVVPDTDEEGSYMTTMAIQLPPFAEYLKPIEVWVKVLPGKPETP
jgi:hypothetical protein